MAITIDWGTKVINIPKADTQLVQSSPTEIRSLDLNTFRLTLKDLEDDPDGMAFPTTHNHNPPVTVGGVTLARVVEIINGYTITFEDGQYAVNLVGANSNVADVVNVNQVSVRSANSAGLTYSKQVEDLSFSDSRVWINTISGMPGTAYPRGTISDPVDNLADAQAIIAQRNLPKRLHITGPLTISGTDDLSDYDIQGASSELSSLTIQIGANTNNLILADLAMTGDLNGDITARGAVSFSNIIDFDGKMVNCGLSGTIALGTGGAQVHQFIDCYSDVAGTNTPIIDADNLTILDLQMRRYAGGIEVRNFSDSQNTASFDLTSGRVILHSTCTAGTIVVRGTGQLVDNSGPGCTVIKTGLVEGFKLDLAEKILRNKFVTDPNTGVATLYDDDGSTVLMTANLYEGITTSQPYRGQGAERRERLQ